MHSVQVATLVALALALPAALAPAAAAQAADPPVFSDPTNITNLWAPFRPDSVKLYRGQAEGDRTAVIERHLVETRSFAWRGQTVACRVLEERDFVNGALEEIARTWLAQDDAGNVHLFGEISWVYAGGELVDVEDDSWLVGGPTEDDDPPEVTAVADPAMFMLADPQVGDSFQLESAGESPETLTVLAETTVKVAAGQFTRALRIREDDGEDGGEPPQFQWVVAGVGLVKERAKGDRSELIATDLVEVPEPAAY